MKDFSRSLLDSAKTLDVPAAGAKARAADAVVAKLATGAGTAAALAKATTVATAKVGLATYAAAAALVVASGAGLFAAGRATAPTVTKTAVVTAEPPSAATHAPESTPAPRPSAPATAVPAAEAAAPNACKMHAIPDGPPKTCSGKGKSVPITVKNLCADDVDVFWVDAHCEEIFHARLAPGGVFERITQDAHVWRIRDHATHALLKEALPQRVPGTPASVDDHKPATLPDVVLKDGDRPLDESEPKVCSGSGGPAKFTIQNDRQGPVSVMWVTRDCQEKYMGYVGPGERHSQKAVEADAFRFRDAKTGELLQEIVPTSPDLTVFISVP